MSLGAIDFGLVVDSSVIMVENAVRRLTSDRRAAAPSRSSATPPSRSAARRSSAS
jgi:Cu/Ag efflux pump CusA